MQRSVVGAANLNQALQEAVNPGTFGLKRGGYLYRQNDKVMQIRNNYDKEVFNGDIGAITFVDLEDRSLKVDFDGREIEYDVTELDELVLAYATTIHKAQGSEYPIVVMPVTMNHFVMLQRNLIYTGITRAKKIMVIVGTKKALAYAVKNVTVADRNTMLKERIRELVLDRKVMPFPTSESGKDKAIQYTEQNTQVQMVAENSSSYQAEKVSHEEWLKEDLFSRLSRSRFRSRFALSDKDREYISEKGIETIRSHAKDLIGKRLAPAIPENDGKQTPMKGHPVFIAQHATGTCCRGCLYKWHGIPEGQELTDKEQEYVVGVIMEWISRNAGNSE